MVLLEEQMKYQPGHYYHTGEGGGVFLVGGGTVYDSNDSINSHMIANPHPWAFKLLTTCSHGSFFMDFGNDIAFEQPLMTKALKALMVNSLGGGIFD